MTAGLLVVGHGSADGGSQKVATAVAAAATFALGNIPAVAAFLGHDEIDVSSGLTALADRGASVAIVVPLLLGAAHHVAELPDLLGDGLPYAITEHLGPHPLVIDALVSRIGDRRPGSIVLAAAGTSEPSSQAETIAAAGSLSGRIGVSVTAAFLSSAEPSVESAIGDGEPLLVPYLLADGHFSSRLQKTAVEHGLECAPVIGAHPKIVELVIRRYRALVVD